MDAQEVEVRRRQADQWMHPALLDGSVPQRHQFRHRRPHRAGCDGPEPDAATTVRLHFDNLCRVLGYAATTTDIAPCFLRVGVMTTSTS